MSHDPEDWCKIWKKKQIDLLFQKWPEFVKFDQSTRKYKKFAFSFVPIMQSI